MHCKKGRQLHQLLVRGLHLIILGCSETGSQQVQAFSQRIDVLAGLNFPPETPSILRTTASAWSPELPPELCVLALLD